MAVTWAESHSLSALNRSCVSINGLWLHVTSDTWIYIYIWSSCMSVLRPSPSPTVYTKHSVCTKHSGLHSTYQHSTSSTPFSSTGCNPWPAGSLACRADGWPSHRWPTWPTEVRRTLGSGISSWRSASRGKCTFSSMKSYVCIIYIYINIVY